MKEISGQITCPHCQSSFQVEEAMAQQFEGRYKQEMEAFKKQMIEEFNTKQDSLRQREAAFEAKKKKENELFRDRLEQEKEKLSKDLESRMSERFNLRLLAQAKELNELTQEINQLREKEIELHQVKRRMDLQQKELEFEFEKKLVDTQKDIEESISKRVYQEMELKLMEKDKQLADQRKLISEMQRKADQGSVQLQGEVQEIAIEDWLKANFPLDKIEEIKKGARGADCKQVVNTRLRMQCGTIYYESKRTKEFQNTWIEKFKQDMIRHGADLGVIVTKVLPRGMERMGQKSGIWICTFEEFKALCFILRQMLIKVGEVSDHERNKGDKMNLLYRYLTSNEFKLKIESIVDGFSQMQTDLQKEKNAMTRIWSQREKQIQKVLINTTEMYGDIKGIAGTEIPNVRQLELPIDSKDIFDLDAESINEANS